MSEWSARMIANAIRFLAVCIVRAAIIRAQPSATNMAWVNEREI